MADRTFTEGEAYALVADGIARETAAVQALVTAAETARDALVIERDTLEVRATAAEDRATAAEKALEDYKTSIETEKARETKRAERVALVADVAPSLKLEGEREDRIVAMADEVFTDYVTSLREVAAMGMHQFKKAAKDGDSDCATCGKAMSAGMHMAPQKAADGDLPRESAAFKGGSPGAGSSTDNSVKGIFAARRAAMAPART